MANKKAASALQKGKIYGMHSKLIAVAAKGGANYSKSVYDLLRNMTNDGAALNTRTAA